jgi:hypothetical protein
MKWIVQETATGDEHETVIDNATCPAHAIRDYIARYGCGDVLVMEGGPEGWERLALRVRKHPDEGPS